jgi:hypothetical protein
MMISEVDGNRRNGSGITKECQSEHERDSSPAFRLEVCHNGMERGFFLNVSPDKTFAELTQYICQETGGVMGTTDANGHWVPKGYPEEEGWVFHRIDYYAYDDHVELIEGTSIPLRFRIAYEAPSLPTDKPMSELGIDNGDVIILHLVMSRNNKNWLPHFVLDGAKQCSGAHSPATSADREEMETAPEATGEEMMQRMDLDGGASDHQPPPVGGGYLQTEVFVAAHVEDQRTDEETISISIAHNGTGDEQVFTKVSVQTNWTLEHLVLQEIPKLAPHLLDADARPNGFDESWKYNGYKIFPAFDVSRFQINTGMHLRFDVPDDVFALDANKEISDLHIPNCSLIYLYFDFEKDGMGWAEHHPIISYEEEDESGPEEGMDLEEHPSDHPQQARRGCPETLKVVVDSIGDHVDVMMKTEKRFCPAVFTERITVFKKRLKKETRQDRRQRLNRNIHGLEQAKLALRSEARRMHINTHLLWEHPECVDSLRYDKRTGEWRGIVWTSRDKAEEMTFTCSYVRGTLLANFAYKRKKAFISDEFILLKKYYRKKTVDEGHYVSVRKVKEKSYSLTDLEGRVVSDVTEVWVRKHLPREIQSELKDVSVGGSVRITEGSRTYGGTASSAWEKQSALKNVSVVGSVFNTEDTSSSAGLPKIQHRNRAEDCLLKCLASALYYIGLQDLALLIAQRYRRDFNLSMEFIRGTVKREGRGRVGSFRKVRDHRYCAVNTSYRPPNPILASLKAEVMGDNGRKLRAHINHCVCFVDEYVFDANMETALPISAKSLDDICHSIVPGSTYAGIYWSRELLIKP